MYRIFHFFYRIYLLKYASNTGDVTLSTDVVLQYIVLIARSSLVAIISRKPIVLTLSPSPSDAAEKGSLVSADPESSGDLGAGERLRSSAMTGSTLSLQFLQASRP